MGSTNWKRVLMLIVGVPILLLVILVFYSVMDEYVRSLPTMQDGFLGLKLGMTKNDVLFLKGRPYWEEKGWDKPYNYEEKPFLAYIANGNCLELVRFAGDEIHMIELWQLGDSKCHGGFKDIGIGSEYDEIIEKFGEPSSIETSKDSFERIISYEKYNVFFQLSKGKADRIGIYNPKLGQVEGFYEIAWE